MLKVKAIIKNIDSCTLTRTHLMPIVVLGPNTGHGLTMKEIQSCRGIVRQHAQVDSRFNSSLYFPRRVDSGMQCCLVRSFVGHEEGWFPYDLVWANHINDTLTIQD